MVSIKNENSADLLFLTKFANKLQKRLDLITDNKVGNICKVEIDFNKSEYSTVMDESGYTGRKNFKIAVNYILNTSNSRTIKDTVVFFYGATISDNYYSEYVANKKRNTNDVDILSEKVFYSIINNLKK